MGNYRFKLSDMMPNAWFYKLRDNMNKPKNPNSTKKKLPSQSQNPRKSIYQTSPKNMKAFDTQFPQEPPRRSSKARTRRKAVYKPSPRQITPSVCACREPEFPVWLKPGSVPVQDNFGSPADFPTSPDQDFIGSYSSSEYEEYSHDSPDYRQEAGINSWSAEFELISELGLRPILTKPGQQKTTPAKLDKKKSRTSTSPATRKSVSRSSTSPASRKSVSRSGGVKIRNKLTSMRTETARGRKSVKCEKKGMFYSQSFAIVKASVDPEQDFRESMMEMIVENNISASKDLEDLLACYLSLNSNQYHDLIIKAFEQIWFTMPQH